MVKIISPIENQFTQEDLLLLDKLNIEQLAKSSGYYKRAPKKITATLLFKSFLMMKKSALNSLSAWASELGKLAKCTVSKEALIERLNEPVVELFEKVMKDSLALKLNVKNIQTCKKNNADLVGHFNRILTQNGSSVSLRPSPLSVSLKKTNNEAAKSPI